MDQYEQTEFWKALGRLYDSTAALRDASERLLEIAERHERRLDRAEITIEAILEDLRRKRKGEEQ